MSSSSSKRHHSKSSVSDIIDKVIKEKVTVGGHSGHFVRRSQLEDLEAHIKALSASSSSDPVDAKRLKDAQDALKEYESINAKSEEIIKQAKERVVIQNKNAQDVLDKLEASTKELAEFKLKAGSEKAGLENTLKQWKAHAAALKEQIKSNAELPGPEGLQLVQAELADATSKVQQSMDELRDVNKELAAMQSKHNVVFAESKAAKERAATLTKELEIANAAKERASKKSVPDGVATVLQGLKLDDSVKTFVGTKAFDWLLELQKSAASDVRNATYTLLRVTRESSNKKVSKLTWILQQVLDWIKTVSTKARGKVQPWIEMIARDIATNQVKTVTWYREKLQELVAEHKFEKKKKLDEDPGSLPSTLDDLKAWFQVLVINRPKRFFSRAFGNVSSGTSRVFSSVKRFFSRMFLKVRKQSRQSGEKDEVIYDYDTDDVMIDESMPIDMEDKDFPPLSKPPDEGPFTVAGKRPNKGKGKEVNPQEPSRNLGGLSRK